MTNPSPEQAARNVRICEGLGKLIGFRCDTCGEVSPDGLLKICPCRGRIQPIPLPQYCTDPALVGEMMEMLFNDGADVDVTKDFSGCNDIDKYLVSLTYRGGREKEYIGTTLSDALSKAVDARLESKSGQDGPNIEKRDNAKLPKSLTESPDQERVGPFYLKDESKETPSCPGCGATEPKPHKINCRIFNSTPKDGTGVRDE